MMIRGDYSFGLQLMIRYHVRIGHDTFKTLSFMYKWSIRSWVSGISNLLHKPFLPRRNQRLEIAYATTQFRFFLAMHFLMWGTAVL
jgi:hypothetical protein